MTRSSKAYKTRLLRTAGALFAICVMANPAAAQYSNDTAELLNRINQLENQIQTLSRSVYRGDSSSSTPSFLPQDARPSSPVSGAAAAGFETRMSALEDAQRNLTGQIEKINFDVQQVKKNLERMQVDTEQRFQQQQPMQAPSPAPVAAPAAPQPSQQLGTLGGSSGHSGPAEEMYEKAFASIRAGKYDTAQKEFQGFLRQYPGHPLASNAQYWLGETYYVRGDFKFAAKTFAEGYQNFPKGPKAQDSLLKLGLSLSKLNRKDDACLSLRQLQKEVTDDANPLRGKAAAEIKQLGCP